MKNQMGSYLLILLFAVGLNARASRPEENPSLKVHFQEGLEGLGTSLIREYGERHPGTDIRMEIFGKSELKAGLETADLLLAGKGCLQVLGTDAGFRMVVGRKVIVPLINSSHPQYQQLMERGLSRERIAAIYSGQDENYHPLIPGDACFQTYLEDFAGLSSQLIRARVVEMVDQMPLVVQNDPKALGFCSLACLLRLEQEGAMEGLSLVPLDMDGSGALEHRENFYASVASLQHAIYLGKYPPSLYGRIYALSASTDLPESAEDLLSWIIGDGQALLALQGVVSLDPSEQMSEAQQLVEASGAVQAEASGRPTFFRVILAFSALLGVLLWVVFGVLGRKSPKQEGPEDKIGAVVNEGMPAGYYFDKSHTWSFMEKEGTVLIGVDAFLLNVSGPLSRISLKKGVTELRKGEPFLQLIQDGKQLEVQSPVSGQLLELNPALAHHADLLNKDPFGDGWICRVKPSGWKAEIRSFFMITAYRDWIREELDRLKAFLVKKEPALQDGGAPVSQVLKDKTPREWEDFQTEFLNKA